MAVEPWITADVIIQTMSRNGIRLTKQDAEIILSKLDQPGAYANHENDVRTEIWRGEPINGVDVSKGRIRKKEDWIRDEKDPTIQHLIKREYPDPSDQFISTHKGLAYKMIINDKLVGFQPHHPGIHGFHALTSSKIKCYCGQFHDKCPTCGEEHDIEEVMQNHILDVIRSRASNELQTQILYMAQEINDRRMQALDRLSRVS